MTRDIEALLAAFSTHRKAMQWPEDLNGAGILYAVVQV
jgi:hypothetical protein